MNKTKLYLGTILGLFFFLNSTAQIKPVSYWENLYDSANAANYSTTSNTCEQTWDNWSQSGNSYDHYNLSYAFDAKIAMFQATGNVSYLNSALTLAMNILSTAQISNSANFPTSSFQDG